EHQVTALFTYPGGQPLAHDHPLPCGLFLLPPSRADALTLALAFLGGPFEDELNFQRSLAQAFDRFRSELPFGRQGNNADPLLEQVLDEVVAFINSLTAEAVEGLDDEDGAGEHGAALHRFQERAEVADQGVLATESRHAEIMQSQGSIQGPAAPLAVVRGAFRLAAEGITLRLRGTGKADVTERRGSRMAEHDLAPW